MPSMSMLPFQVTESQHSAAAEESDSLVEVRVRDERINYQVNV